MKSKRYFYLGLLLLFVGVAAFATLPGRQKQEQTANSESKNSIIIPRFTLLELFTSEGCSSCPPSYKVINEIEKSYQAQSKKIIVLDFHVDYFNNLGWIDPFSKKEFTKRQESYQEKLAGDGVYTPQLVVNGKYECVGSDRSKAAELIEKGNESGLKSSITITKVEKLSKDSISVAYNAVMVSANAILNFAITQDNATVKVLAGENRGMTLNHHHLVRSMTTTNFLASSGKVHISLGSLPENEKYTVVAFVQDSGNLEVLAADSKE